MHDGVMPSNEGRGYVLRKIMRRALRNVRMIGVEDPFLYKMTGFVAELMAGPYPEMLESVQRVARVVKDEEHRYATTFLVAERVFNDAIKNISGQGIPGALSFKLYDTYGLALDEQEEMAREHGLTLDREAFESEMEHQRERARASWKGAEKGAVVPAYQALLEQRGRTKFLGYSEVEATSRVVALIVDKQQVERVAAGTKAELVLDQTPFYAESGGQVGDHGVSVLGDGREGGGCGDGIPGGSGADGAPHRDACGDGGGRYAARGGGGAAARCDAAQSYGDAPAARVAAAGAGDAREAGGICGGSGAAAFRFHALRGAGSRRIGGSGAADEPADSEEHGGDDGHTAFGPGDRHGGDGAVRREVRRAGAGGFGAGLQQGTVRRHARAAHGRYRRCARSCTRAASRRACGGSRR